jgi:hypothetical protein
MHPVKFEFREPPPISGLAPRSSRHERFYRRQGLRVLPPHEVQEFLKECPIVTLLLASLLRRTQMRRMYVAEFIDGAEVFVFFFSPEGEVSGATQGSPLYLLAMPTWRRGADRGPHVRQQGAGAVGRFHFECG